MFGEEMVDLIYFDSDHSYLACKRTFKRGGRY